MSTEQHNQEQRSPDSSHRRLVEPLIYRICAPGRLHPFAVFLIVSFLLAPLTWFSIRELVTPLSLAYAVALSNYLVNCHEKEFARLAHLASISPEEFEAKIYTLRRLSRRTLVLSWTGGPLLAVLINLNGPFLTVIKDGGLPGIGMAFNFFLAFFFWVYFIQIITTLIRNSLIFKQVGEKSLEIDLLTTENLTPFAAVGIRNILIVVGQYIFVPLAFINSTANLQGVLASLVITLPIAILLLIIPMSGVRQKIIEEKRSELDIINRSLRGDENALSESKVLSRTGGQNTLNMILYRKLIEDINEWPINASLVVRLVLYVVLPPMTWIAAAMVERLVDTIL